VGVTPGGEGKVASSARPKSSYRRASQDKNYYSDSFPQRPRRGGFSGAYLAVYNTAHLKWAPLIKRWP